MITANVFSIKPEVKDKELVMVATFAQVARWSTKTLLTADVPVRVWLQFLEDCMEQFNTPDHVLTPGFFTIEVQKSQVKLIGGGTHAFTIRKSQWKPFVHQQVERLLLEGVVSLEEEPK